MKKNASVFNLLLTAAIFPLLFGCQKGMTDKQANLLSGTAKQGTTPTALGTTPDVYVAGSDGGQAAYWKNGVETLLSGGIQASGIVAIGTNVYVCGWGVSSTTGQFIAEYWLNGVLTNLSDGTSSALATGIAVSGTNVYIAGTEGLFVHTGVYWTNGVATSLGTGQPYGIFVDANGNIYIPNEAVGSPSYWLNGTLVHIPGGTATQTVTAIAAQVSGTTTNVYAVGFDNAGVSGMSSEKAVFWENGSAQYLNTSNFSAAYAVALNATGQPYISGTSTSGSVLADMQISYWVGATGDLSTLNSTAEFEGITTGITVDQTTGDIYVCGSQYNSPSTPPEVAMYWQITGSSGITPVTLPTSSTSGATAYAITLGQ